MRRFLATVFAALAAASVYALDTPSLESMLDESLAMWEAAVPYVRLGKAPSLASLDFAPIAKALAADIRGAGRYKEFAYLFEYLDRQSASKRLEVRVVADIPPTPGFWPARLSDARRAIVISSVDLEALKADEQLYRSSFLRALATLYYADQEPPLKAAWRGRNVANEYAAFMSGLWVESMYLLQILEVGTPRYPAPDYYNLLLGSAQYDNLAGASAIFFLMDMEAAYGLINGFRDVKAQRDAIAFAQAIPPKLAELLPPVRLGAYGFSPSDFLLARGASARTFIMLYPWLELSLSRSVTVPDRPLASARDACLRALADLEAVYRYFDPIVAAERQKRLNAMAFRPEDPDSPPMVSPYPVNPPDSPASLPGAASEEWFCFCQGSDPFSLGGFMPLDASLARGQAAYRFSRDSGGALLAVEYFVLGKPRSSASLQYASRVSVERNGATETWRWENPYGKVIVNEAGWAAMVVRADGGSSVMSFYALDRRRVHDDSGAWSVERAPRAVERAPQTLERAPQTLERAPQTGDPAGAGAYELRYLDGAGRLYSGALGYALDRRSDAGPDSTERSVFGVDGRPATIRSVGVHGSSRETRWDAGVATTVFRFRDEAGEPAPFLGDHVMRIETASRDSLIVDMLDAGGQPSVGPLGYSRDITVFRDGLPLSESAYGPAGEAVSFFGGYHARVLTYDGEGNPVVMRLLDTAGGPAQDAFGIHRRESAFDARGLLKELRFFGADGRPAADDSGAARIRWSLSAEGEPVGVEAWDANGIPLTQPVPGEI